MNTIVLLDNLNLGGYGGLLFFIFFIMFGIPIILFIIGAILFGKGKKKQANIFFIIAFVYLLIGLGVCGGLIS